MSQDLRQAAIDLTLADGGPEGAQTMGIPRSEVQQVEDRLRELGYID
jgi:hypothetical protein